MNKSKLFSLKTIIIAVILFMLIIITVVIVNLLNPNDGGAKKTRTDIAGLPSNIPSDISALIKAGLYDAIALNLSENETPPKTGAIIRSGTLEDGYDKDTDLYYGDFITDIESVKQSFSIHYEWTTNKNNQYISGYPVTVLCVEQSERKYNTTSCSDEFHQADPVIDSFADKYLPFSSKTTSGIDFNIFKDYPDREPVITVVSYTCEGSNEATEVKTAAENWLKQKIGKDIDLSSISYKNYCNGMMNNFPPVVKNKK